MDNISQIQNTEKVLNDATNTLKLIQDKTFASVIKLAMDKSQDKDKALLQEFAKESGKIFSDTLKNKQPNIEATLQKLKANYEQRINNS